MRGAYITFDGHDLSSLPTQGKVIVTINNKDIQLLYIDELNPEVLIKERDNVEKFNVFKLKSYNG